MKTGVEIVASSVAALFLLGCVSASEMHLRERHSQAAEVFNARDSAAELPGKRFGDSSTLDEYVRHAFANNPRLRAAFDRSKAALERIPQARSLDDPTLSFEYFIEQMGTRYRFGLTQMFPAFGVLRLRQDRAAAEAVAAAAAFDAERFELYERVVRAFYEYHYLARATAINQENIELLVELEQAVSARYESGAAPFADLIKVQVEKDRLADRLANLRDQRGAQSAGLSALLNLPVNDALPWPVVEPAEPVVVNEAVLAGMLAELNPELDAAEAMIETARAGEELARRSGWPGYMLGAGWMVMPGMDGRGDESDVGIMAGVTLPVWRGRIRAARNEAAAMRQAATSNRDDMWNRLRAELSTAVFRFRDAERRIELFETSLLPKARQALEVAEQDYASGNTEFMTLIDAQRILLEFQLLGERAIVDREIALGDISCCIGALEF